MSLEGMFFQSWTGIIRTILVGTLAFATLVLFLRISGKRTLAKLNAFDLVVTVALGSTLATILLSESVALAEGVTALGLLIGLQYAVTFTSVRWRGFAKTIRSEPTLLVRKGELCKRAMRRQRVTEDEIESAIRASGGHSIRNAESVILEADGSLSIAISDGSAG